MRRSGFTLIEMIIVLGVVSVTAGIAVPVYRDYQIKSDLNLATEQVAQGIERARLLSQASTGDAEWGFYVPEGVLYKGTNYGDRDPSFDEIYPMPSTIKVFGLYEVAYDKVEGKPSETGEIKLTTINNEERTVSIEVYQQSIAVTTPDMITVCIDGVPTSVQEHEVPMDPVFPMDGSCGEQESSVSSEQPTSEAAVSSATSDEAVSSDESASEAAVSSAASEGAASSIIVVGGSSSAPGGESIECGAGKKLICHVPPGNPSNRNTLCVATPSWPAHRAHGDTEGACETEIDEPTPPPVCADRFVIGEDHALTLTGTADVTVRVLGSEITFGANGPPIPVFLESVVNGKTKKLFTSANNGVQGGEVAVISDVPAGATFAVQAEGEYKQNGWLRFRNTILSGDGTGHFGFFQNGAPLPNYPIFGGQQSVVAFLDGYLDTETGRVALPSNAVLLLGELGTSLNGESADFQDIVVLLEFGEPDCN